jgi:ABC-type transport system involved in cytochrome c biogenesis permease subunit
MSAGTWSDSPRVQTGQRANVKQVSFAYSILKAMGSLKITVTMFALGILLVLFGTLAQDEQSLAEVKRLYFNSWLAIVPLDVLFPVTLSPHDIPYPGQFPFPGGATIGLILMVNLVAAKSTRFSAQGKGAKLGLGLLISAIGGFLVFAVITSGHAVNGLQGKPPLDYDTLWAWLRVGFGVIAVAMVIYAATAKGLPNLARILVSLAAVLSLTLAVSLFVGGASLRLNDPGLRIVWQLLQATIASSVLLAGLWLIFGKRGGNVLIHVGVALLMVGQFIFGDRQVEQRLNVAEGSETSLVFRQDELELALIDTSADDEDSVLAIPETLIRRVVRGDGVIDQPDLPVVVRIVEWMPNSDLIPVESDSKSQATDGIGLQYQARGMKTHGAAEEDPNIASAYVELKDRRSGDSLGTYLVSQFFNDRAQVFMGGGADISDELQIDGKPYELSLRYRREYKPYTVKLEDVVRINYSGSETPRDYSSQIVIRDNADPDKFMKGRTWMNNPLRYQGETFYQSNYYAVPSGGGSVEAAGLQVVENAGWVIPYVCCMMVLVGMAAHFGGTFVTFASRYDRGSIPSSLGARTNAKEGATNSAKNVSAMIANPIPVAIGLGIAVACVAYFARPENASVSEIDWKAIASLPMHHEGRIKPVDTVARNVLQRIYDPIFGGVVSVKDKDGNKHSPAEWLMATLARSEWAAEAPVFRIDSKEVREIFELEARPGFRYSFAELAQHFDALEEALEPLRKNHKEGDVLEFRDQKIAEINSKLNAYQLLAFAYEESRLPSVDANDQAAVEEVIFRFQQLGRLMERIEGDHPPAMIPPVGDPDEHGNVEGDWRALGPASYAELKQKIGGDEVLNPATAAVQNVLTAIRNERPTEINGEVRSLEKQLAKMPAAASALSKVSTERWLNRFNLTGQGITLYLLAIMLGFVSFMVGKPSIRRTTFWLLVGVFVIHTIAILARMYVSGRAPVINLYSSAVFIGWACVLFCLALEMIYPIGIANLVAGMIGLVTLCIAKSLDTSDTLHVLQAVLDTQFWLSTHVVTVSMGYAVTFLAGFIGICALVHRVATGYDGFKPGQRPKDSEDVQNILYRMGYGAVCFGIFFSFVGTVLGGLWADDSWGRFWGWDPKENGALMIVMWNALVLHSRWDKQVGPRGFAILTMVGNIVTAWSWFGTNLLGIGLHNYGFSKSVAYALVITVALHLALIFFALIFTQVLSRRIAKA